MNFQYKLTLLNLVFYLTLVYSTSSTRHGGRRFVIDINQVTNSLFPYHDDPFSTEDTWAALSDSYKKAWTEENLAVPKLGAIMESLEKARHIERHGILIHVDIKIIAAPQLIDSDLTDSITRYAKVMRAGRNGTMVHFDVSFAHDSLYNRLTMHSKSQHPSQFMGILEQDAITSGYLNVMYVIVNHAEDPVTNFTPNKPFVGERRVSWYFYEIPRDKNLNPANLLVSTESIAQRVFAPTPFYHPIPFLHDFTVEVSAYTPGHDSRASWLENFEWEEFESLIRSYVIHGQRISFYSVQTNAECSNCQRSFRNIEHPGYEFIERAAFSLNNDFLPNETWALGFHSSHLNDRIPPRTFRLFMVDTSLLKKSEQLSRFERKGVSSFPGMGIVIFRSSDKRAITSLDSAMTRAVISGVYGITEPDLYIPNIEPDQSTQQPSAILKDVMARSYVRSMIETRVGELSEILDGILHFDVDPSKALDERIYTKLIQRINLLLYKMEQSQKILSLPNEQEKAIYMAASTAHDIKAIRLAFNLNKDSKAYDRFKDPTVRCHFSRLKRQALRASEIIESTYSVAGLVGRALMISTITAFLTYISLRKISTKLRGKRE